MWKNILAFCLFIAICFLIPSIFIKFNNTPKAIVIKEKDNSGDDDSKEPIAKEMIRLLLSESNQVVELTMDDYLKGVLLR